MQKSIGNYKDSLEGAHKRAQAGREPHKEKSSSKLVGLLQTQVVRNVRNASDRNTFEEDPSSCKLARQPPQERRLLTCPLCGRCCATKDQLEVHIQQEIDSLDSDKEEEEEEQASPVQNRKRKRKFHPQQAQVLVIGGSVDDGIPRTRKPPPISAPPFNHYMDGRGFLDSDQIGLDGALDSLRWEGFGATEY